MIKSFDNKTPSIGKDTFVAETATVCGDVTLGDNVSVWFGAAIRGDEGKIVIGNNSNIQDNATVHSKTRIGNGVTVGHNAIVHGCTVCDNVLIGMGAIVLDGAEIGECSIVGAGALVTGGKVFPPKSLIIGSPASVKRELSDEQIESIKENAEEYVKLTKKYL
ncbi:MAG: gamma carbonic anhydrase family protein [Oscillospiraceae bacterium]|nr:gamma carbonic anhydrase family protein [Oscillospiraceae bacterium]